MENCTNPKFLHEKLMMKVEETIELFAYYPSNVYEYVAVNFTDKDTFKTSDISISGQL